MTHQFLRTVNIDLISTDASIIYSDTHRVFYIDDPIEQIPGTHMLLALTSFNMVYSFYQFREGINDRFTMTINEVSHTIIIEEGNYTIAELITYINTVFTGLRVSYGLDVLGMINDSKINKILIDLYPHSAVEFTDVLAYKEIGFNTSGTRTFPTSGTVYFDNQYNLAGDPSIYIRVKNQQVININSKHIDGIVANIPVMSSYGQYIFYLPSEPNYFRCSSNFSKLDISILDQDMNDITNLNTGSPWRMTFSVKYSSNRPNELNNLQKDFNYNQDIQEKKKD